MWAREIFFRSGRENYDERGIIQAEDDANESFNWSFFMASALAFVLALFLTFSIYGKIYESLSFGRLTTKPWKWKSYCAFHATTSCYVAQVTSLIRFPL